MKLFCVYDAKASFYLKPFTEQSTVQALRGFDAAVNEGDSQLKKFPDDFELHEIGEFDESTGTLQSRINNLGSARMVLRKPEMVAVQ